MKPALVSLLALFAVVACSDKSPSEPTQDSPTAVPAGISDPAWAAAGSSCVAESPVRSISASQRGTLSPFVHGAFRTDDDDWVDVAKSAPGGLGGLFLEAGTPVIYLVDPSKRDAAVAAIRTSVVAPFGVDLNATVARQGRWNFVQLADWFRLLTPHITALGKPVFADIHEARNRIEYVFSSSADRDAAEHRLAQLDIPCFLVAVRVLPA